MCDVALANNFALQCRSAVECRYHQKHYKSNEVGQEFGKEAFLHIGLFKRDKISPFALILFMRWLLFLTRLAFICNLFFLLAVSLQLSRWFQNQDAEALVIIIGYFMAALVNPVANICVLFLLLQDRIKLAAVPRWLLFSNGLFLILQIIYLIHLNAAQHS